MTCDIMFGNYNYAVPMCPSVVPVNGNTTFNGTTPGSVVQYRCNDGYFLVGSRSQVCQENETWTGELPECFRKWKHQTKTNTACSTVYTF